MISQMHTLNQAWFSKFKERPSHASIAVLNHIDEADSVTDAFAETLGNPNVIHVSKEDKVVIENVREMQKLAKLRSSADQSQLFVFDARAGFTLPAQNSLLKVLEEPPIGTNLLIIADSLAEILPTIRSRSRLIRILPLSPENHLSQSSSILSGWTEADLAALGATTRYSFAIQPDSKLPDFAVAKEFISSSLGDRMKLVTKMKKREDALAFIHQVTTVTSKAMTNVAKAQKSGALKTWAETTAACLEAEAQLKGNVNVSLVLSKLCYSAPLTNTK